MSTTVSASAIDPAKFWQPRQRTAQASWGQLQATWLERPTDGTPYLVQIGITKPYAAHVPFTLWRGDEMVRDGGRVPAKPGDYGDSVEVPNTPANAAKIGALLASADQLLNKVKPFKTGEHVTGVNPLALGVPALGFSRHDPNDDSFRNEYFLGPRADAPEAVAALARAILKVAEDNGLVHRARNA